jgi:Alanine dehydrogenase
MRLCPSAIQLANKGWRQACSDNLELKLGLNVVNGKVCYRGVADAFDLDYTPVEDVLGYTAQG